MKLHFEAVVKKRLLYLRKDKKGLMGELLAPCVILILVLMLVG